MTPTSTHGCDRRPARGATPAGVSVWEGDCEGFRRFALHHANNTALTCDDDGQSFVCEVPIQFEARPDNEYSPDALAVVVPHWLHEQVGAHHIGYIYDRNLTVFGPAIRRLMRATGRPVVCTAILPCYRPGLLPGEMYESLIKDGYIDSEGVSPFTLDDFAEALTTWAIEIGSAWRSTGPDSR